VVVLDCQHDQEGEYDVLVCLQVYPAVGVGSTTALPFDLMRVGKRT
jgi:hypothetical protein